MDKSWADLVVGVDLGTTGTAVAYAKPTENQVKCLKSWPQEPEDLMRATRRDGYDKVPSMIAFQDDKVEAWGFGVMTIPADTIRYCSLYKLFKPQFDSSNLSDRLNAEKCMRAYLKALLEHLKVNLKDQLPRNQNWDESRVKFLFSYPTTWNQDTRDRFSSCVEDAGYNMVDDQASMTSLDEAEASMLHFFSSVSGQTGENLPDDGEHILVADIGGGTSDMSIFKVGERLGQDVDLMPVVCDMGEDIGSTQIDDEFKDKLRPELMDIYRERSRRHPDSHPLSDDSLERYVDATLLHLEHNSTYAFQKHTYGQDARDGRLVRPEFELKIPDPFETGVQDQRFRTQSYIHIPIHKEKFFKNAFDVQCSKIWEQCQSQMERLRAGQTVKHVVLTGGLGSSIYVKKELSKKFAAFARGRNVNPPDITQIRDAQIAVCQGLVHDELRKIHGNPIWVYPAVASYGIQKGGNKNEIKWFVKNGAEVKVPHEIKIDRDVDLEQNGKAKSHLDFKLVKVKVPPPEGLFVGEARRQAWNQRARAVTDVSNWVKESLPEDLKKRFLLPRKASLTIKATMLRETIAMTLYQGKQELGKTLFVTEEWHKNPGVREGRWRAPKSKAWKFNLSTGEKIAGVGVAIGAISLIIAGLNHFHRSPQSAPSYEQSGQASGEGGQPSGEGGQANAT
ncbi:hypothetical protein BHE90_003950 [Fusarium euwallaceae]|uniref:Uncharacterized protein n=1 Tax=Fusarium euwallaceae TaxID=1147111 RepID=A0A430M0M9_9HYPO|nr:hypothetical protein BHE90_003950 [Fusarium euwallaceae]